jgi:hypothetical protein
MGPVVVNPNPRQKSLEKAGLGRFGRRNAPNPGAMQHHLRPMASVARSEL